jgi:hypothetical protein
MLICLSSQIVLYGLKKSGELHWQETHTPYVLGQNPADAVEGGTNELTKCFNFHETLM